MIINSKTAFSGRAFKVTNRTIQTPFNQKIKRDVIVRDNSVTALIVDKATEQMLGIEEYRAGNNALVWGLPAGMIDKGETPRQAILREIQEEVGLKVESDSNLVEHGGFMLSQGILTEKTFIFTVFVDKNELAHVETHFDADEFIGQKRWFHRKQLANIVDSVSGQLALQFYENMRLEKQIREQR